MRRKPLRFGQNQSGATAVIFGITAVILVGAVGVAVDTSRWYKTRTELSAVADAAALAGAAAMADAQLKGYDEKAGSLAEATAEAYVRNKLGEKIVPVISIDETNGKVSVGLDTPGTRTFSKVLGTEDAEIGVASEAIAGTTIQDRACIIALDPSAPVGIDFSLGGSVTAHNCAIWSNATSLSSIDANGSGLVQASTTCAVGGIANGSLTILPAAKSDCVPVHDPLDSWTPPETPITCDFSTTTRVDAGVQMLSPGVYCGGIKVNGNTQLTLAPGIYFLVDGGLKVNGGASILGTGVTLLTSGADASIDVLGSVEVSLSAPSTGPTAGLVIASGRGEPIVSSRIGGGSQIAVEGTVYLPTHDLGYGGNSQSTLPSDFTVLIGRTIKFYGGAEVEVRSDYQNSAVPAYYGKVYTVTIPRLIR